MSTWIERAKDTLKEIIDQVIENCKEDGNLKVRVCFVGYRDIKDNERFTIKNFTEDIQMMKSFIESV